MTDRRLELVWDAQSDVRTPFDALLAAAGRDPEAAAGLTLAYAEMPRAAREKLIEAIRGDVAALVWLLGVEREPALAQAIADALRASTAQPSSGRDVAFGWVDGSSGGVAIVRHLHGDFVDAIRVSWSVDALDAEVLPIGRGDDLDALRRRAGIPDAARRVPREHAVDALTEALWRHHRAGRPIPEAIAPFADLFTPPRRP